MAIENIQVAAAKLVLGIATWEELCQAANRSLDQGQYTLALGNLATLAHPIMAEADPLFRAALRELSVTLPSKDEAIKSLLKYHLTAIANRQVAPREGLQQLMKDVYYGARTFELDSGVVGDSYGLEHLIGYYYGYEDLDERPTEVSFRGKYGKPAKKAVDQEVIRLAAEWLAAHQTVTEVREP